MIRGIEKRRIFLSDDDRIDFVERLGRLLPEEMWRCFAWALMPNHVHLVLQGTTGPLSRLMARLNTGYAKGFNQRHRRSGYLFQNRFRSRIIGDDADLLGVVLYVLRNPLEPGLVSSVQELESYPWCSLGGLLGLRAPRPFEALDACLSLFADDAADAQVRLRSWIGNPEPPTQGAHDSHREAPGSQCRLDVARRLDVPDGAKPAELLDELVRSVGEQLGVDSREIARPASRGVTAEARSLVAFLAIRELEISGTVVARVLGVSPSAVSHAARRGRHIRERMTGEPGQERGRS
jgi:putative transposase